jgi:ribonuclease BN (tRNA processing enzyme)
MPVPHGIVPAVAYRVEIRGHRLVFATDQTAGDETFAEFARGADLLIMHMAIPAGAGQAAKSLHATPEAIGQLAARAEARQLVLSHFMARSLVDLEANREAVSKHFPGRLGSAQDLDCYRP